MFEQGLTILRKDRILYKKVCAYKSKKSERTTSYLVELLVPKGSKVIRGDSLNLKLRVNQCIPQAFHELDKDDEIKKPAVRKRGLLHKTLFGKSMWMWYGLGELTKPDSFDTCPYFYCSNGIHCYENPKHAMDW